MIFKDLIEVERERIQNKDRQLDVFREAVGMADAADERQFRYQTNRLAKEDQHRADRFRLFSGMAWVILTAIVVVVGVSLYMAFWGAEEQRSNALVLATLAASSFGSFALGFVVGQRSRSS